MLDSTPSQPPPTARASRQGSSPPEAPVATPLDRDAFDIDIDIDNGEGYDKPSLLHGGQLIVENEGSTTRDYLAFERNYLSWTKLVVTCLAISGALLIRLEINPDTKQLETSLEHRYAIPVGIVFFSISVLSLLAATTSFFRTQRDMLKGLGHVASGSLVEVTSVLITLTLAAACILFIISTEHSSTL